MPKYTATNKRVWQAMIIIALGIAFVFLLPQLSVLILAALMAFVFRPLYLRLKRKDGWAAAVFTLIVSLLIVIIPIVVILILTAAQLFQLADSLNNPETTDQLAAFLEGVNRFFTTVISPLTGIHVDLSVSSIINTIKTVLPDVIRAFGGFLLGVISTVPQLAIGFIVYIFVFVELLVRGDKLIAMLHDISPFEKAVTSRYIERVGLMANAMVKGQLVISMIISAISAVLLIPLGYGQYVFILFIIFTILNFIPLGCGTLVFPLAIYSGLTGNFWLSVVVLVLYCIVANIDSVLRPIFIPKKIQLSTAVTMVATFCGIAYFGILGVVYGPIIMIIVTTAISLYREQNPSK